MKLYKTLFFFSFLILSAEYLFAQKLEDIITDRPDQTESPYIIPKGFFQFEAGGTYEKEKFDGQNKLETITLPSILIRYGVTKNVELRLETDYLNNDSSGFSQTFTHRTKGFSPLTIGTKIKMFKEKNAIPETAFLF